MQTSKRFYGMNGLFLLWVILGGVHPVYYQPSELPFISFRHLFDIKASFLHPSDVTVGSATLYRLREGIERFFISDINNPAASAAAQSDVYVYYDAISPRVEWFNHIPGGANVLYMDGHVGFIKYPGEFPVTPFSATYLGGDINGPSQQINFSVQ